MKAYVDCVRDLIKSHEDIRIIGSTSIINGSSDDCVIIACGEAKRIIVCRLQNGRQMDISSQVLSAIPILRETERKRISVEAALGPIVAQFYQ